MNRYNITNHFKENRGRIIGFLLLTMLAALLIVTAINMLAFPDSSKGSGDSDNKNKQSQDSRQEESDNKKSDGGNTEDSQASPDNRTAQSYNSPASDLDNRFNQGDISEGADSGQVPKDNGALDGNQVPKGGEDDKYTIPGDIMNELNNKFPEFNIDLSNEKDVPKFPSFGSNNSYSVRTTGEVNHTPLFEVLGKVKNPLFKMMVQENYINSKWYTPSEKNYSLYKYEREPGLDSIKIKPVNPSKGFIPVPGNIKGVEFPVPGVLEFPDMGVFYTDFEMQDYYEVFYDRPVPDESLLMDADVFDSGYDTENAEYIARLAESIVYGIEKPYMKMQAIEQYLKDNYTMDKIQSQTAKNADAVMTFLFDTKRGSQLDFASAYVILLRHAGFKARLATGYKADPGLEYQIVYSDQLCVFPEVKFVTYGWVALDKFTGDHSFSPPVDTKTEITALDTVAKKGEGFTVKGTVCDNTGNPVNGLPVLVYLKKTKEEDCLSYFKGEVSNGTFEITCPINNNVDVGNYQVVARNLASNKYKESWSDPELKVVTETSVNVSAQDTVFLGQEFKLKGFLNEIPSDKAISEDVNVVFNNGIKAQDISPGKNDKDGFNKVFRLSIGEGSRKTGDYLLFGKYLGTYTVEYKGSDFYLPSSREGKVTILVIFWTRIVVLIIILIGTAVAVILTRKKRKRVLAVAFGADAPYEVSQDDARVPEVPEKNTIEISFPQIINPLPNVWGIGEVLTVRFTDEYLNYEEMELSFDKKGEKRISVSFNNRKSNIVSENIRIVCYGEEITSIGKELFNELYARFDLKGEKMTPREIAGAVSGKLDQASCDILYKTVLIFEKAAYSLQDMKRSEYEKFYLLVFKLEIF